jgi:RNA polymerase sigma-70 factor, ECF subfamily
MNCVLQAWSRHEGELRGFLVSRLRDREVAEDLLQDTFLKAIAEGAGFCRLENPRAWLYRVARNGLIDHLRRMRPDSLVLPDDLPYEESIAAPVDDLATCLPRALADLAADDAEAIRLCDLEGMNQVDYARLKGISLPGAKSRVQRARKRLQQRLKEACQVRFDEHGKVCCFVPRDS